MSWRLLDGPSRRQQHISWAVPEHLRETPQHGTGAFRRSRVPDPDALLQYMDNAISATEYAHATRHLSLFMGSSMSTSSLSSSLSPSGGYPVKQSNEDVSVMPSLPSVRKMSRFKSAPPLPQEYINSLLKQNTRESATIASQLSDVTVAQERASTEKDEPSSSVKKQFSEREGVSRHVVKPGKVDAYDARAADDAYRAACCALSEGNAELAVSLLHVASAKCPPDKQSALGKVHRLMGAALQLVEKNSAVLRSLPAER